MSQEDMRWDPSTPGFVTAVLRTLIGLGIATILIGVLIFPRGFSGFVAGGVLAIVLYLIAMRAGSVFTKTGNYALVMLWLFLSQFVLWVGMALLIVWAKVNPIGFVIGVSILPASIVLTLIGYTIRRKRSPS